MAVYSINVLGNVIKDGKEVSKTKILDDIIRLPNKSNKVNRETNKFSELDRGGGLIATENLFSNADGNKDKDSINRVVNSTNKLANSSFGFDSDPNREQTFYNSYNSVFDLNLDNFNNGNVNSVQIFAENLDFYGFPLLLKDIAELAADELPVRLFTLLDMIVAAIVPITTMTTLQFLLQENESSSSSSIPVLFGEDINKKPNEDDLIHELGSYIKYRKSEDFNLVYDVLKKTLQSFERLMNFPRFPFPPLPKVGSGPFAKLKYLAELGLLLLQNIARSLIYFVQGYIFYLNPGLKTKFTLEFDQLKLASLLDLITSFITTDSSRHIYNLLIRKILRNNYFLNKIVNSDSRKQANSGTNINSTLTFLSSFFFRFIGERMSVGEKLIKTDSAELKNKDNWFFQSKYLKENKSTGYSTKKSTLSIGEIINTNFLNTSLDEPANVNFENIFRGRTIETGPKDHRLSREKVKEIESLIDADYMPFTLQDLRTNEVFKFHAFIDSISDSYSANYNEIGGYGRSEKIKIYSNTTRSINVTFKIAAMSPDDHGLMWYLINRLVMMIYPQWSKGVPARDYLTKEIRRQKDMLDSDISSYSLPFTQLPSNSPMIRLRIGDLIASNYSIYTASRLFGFEKKLNEKEKEIEQKKEEQKEEVIKKQETKQDIDNAKAAKDAAETLDILAISSPKIEINNLKREIATQQAIIDSYASIQRNSSSLIKKREKKIQELQIKLKEEEEKLNNQIKSQEEKNKEKNKKEAIELYAKLNQAEGAVISAVRQIYHWEKIKERNDFKEGQSVAGFIKTNQTMKENAEKEVIKKEKELNDFLAKNNISLDEIRLNQPAQQVETPVTQPTQQQTSQTSSNPASSIDQSFLIDFMKAEKNEGGKVKINNPITKAFESNMGKGLAGFITSFGIDWDQGSFWEIKKGSRAPKIATITLGFAPTHDIPLGLDHKGNLRSVAYPVGSNNSISRRTYMNNRKIDYDKEEILFDPAKIVENILDNQPKIYR